MSAPANDISLLLEEELRWLAEPRRGFGGAIVLIAVLVMCTLFFVFLAAISIADSAVMSGGAAVAAIVFGWITYGCGKGMWQARRPDTDPLVRMLADRAVARVRAQMGQLPNGQRLLAVELVPREGPAERFMIEEWRADDFLLALTRQLPDAIFEPFR